jgi:ribosome-associated protein
MDDPGHLVVGPALSLPLAELEYRASRSGGPGGQHVNTSSTRIEVWWDVAGSPALTEEQRARLLARLATRLDSTGRLRLVSSGSRSQLRNREEVTERLRDLVAAALRVPKPRKRTRPSRAAKAARLEAKRRRSAIKRERRPPGAEE